MDTLWILEGVYDRMKYSTVCSLECGTVKPLSKGSLSLFFLLNVCVYFLQWAQGHVFALLWSTAKMHHGVKLGGRWVKYITCTTFANPLILRRSSGKFINFPFFILHQRSGPRVTVSSWFFCLFAVTTLVKLTLHLSNVFSLFVIFKNHTGRQIKIREYFGYLSHNLLWLIDCGTIFLSFKAQESDLK